MVERGFYLKGELVGTGGGIVANLCRRRLRRHSPAPRLPLSGEAARFAHLGLTIGNAQRFSPVAFTRINLKGARSCWGGYRGRWVYLIAPRAGRFAFSALT